MTCALYLILFIGLAGAIIWIFEPPPKLQKLIILVTAVVVMAWLVGWLVPGAGIHFPGCR